MNFLDIFFLLIIDVIINDLNFYQKNENTVMKMNTNDIKADIIENRRQFSDNSQTSENQMIEDQKQKEIDTRKMEAAVILQVI